MSETPKDYDIGYCRPPEATRFKAGQSGNPKGRPKGSANLSTLLDEELAATLVVTIDGRRVRRNKGQIAIRQLVDKAAMGDMRAVAALMKFQGQAGARGASARSPESGSGPSEIPPAAYDEIVANFLANMRGEGEPT